MTKDEGHYYRKQIGCKDGIISWSHSSRFHKAIELVGTQGTTRVLDYGCGDGTLLAMLANKIDFGVGADIAEDQVLDCRNRLGNYDQLSFHTIEKLRESAEADSFDFVLCMETLEHCIPPIVEKVLEDLRYFCKPNGKVIISVPIEIGPTFILKYFLRKFAAWRGLSDYQYYESYTAWNAMRMLLATRKTNVERPIYGDVGKEFHSHYGFNWRRMRATVGSKLHVERTLFTPIACPGGLLSSQAWFLCSKRSLAA